MLNIYLFHVSLCILIDFVLHFTLTLTESGKIRRRWEISNVRLREGVRLSGLLVNIKVNQSDVYIKEKRTLRIFSDPTWSLLWREFNESLIIVQGFYCNILGAGLKMFYRLWLPAVKALDIKRECASDGCKIQIDHLDKSSHRILGTEFMVRVRDSQTSYVYNFSAAFTYNEFWLLTGNKIP